MGWLKKLTKPISKVLDKIIPNEIKPALPYLSAFAPFMMGPGIVGASGFQGALANPWLRASMAGGLNIGSQLAQEGSEGDFSGISALLAAGSGFGTAAGADQTLAGMKTKPYMSASDLAQNPELRNFVQTDAPLSMLDKAKNIGITGAEKVSGFLTDQADILRPGGEPLTMKNALTAASVPVTQGTADLAMITAQQALDDYNNTLDEGSDAWYDDDARRIAIRRAMTMAGHVEDEIVSALAALGLKDGGRVGRAGGGMMSVLPRGVEMDYRGGGMIPMGSKERADDVPARLSKNEFVMTADAVRAAGGGSVNRGAKRMYDLMHNLEARV